MAADIQARYGDHDLMVISPDVGGVSRARELAKRINSPLAIVDKRREKPGEVAEIMRDTYVSTGYKRRQISFTKTELDAVKSALRWAKPGDLILLLSHEQRDKTQAYLKARQD